MSTTWLSELAFHAEKYPSAIVRLSLQECTGLDQSRNGFREFSIIRPHALLDRIRLPTPCLIFGCVDQRNYAHVALAKSKQAVATLDSRLKFRHGFPITPDSEQAVSRLVRGKALSNLLDGQLQSKDNYIQLTPKVSSAILQVLGSRAANRRGLRHIHEILNEPKRFSGNRALAQDALNMALKTLGVTDRPPIRN